MNPFVVYASLDAFELKNQVGEGTYGKVHKARLKDCDEFVALKRIYLKEGSGDTRPLAKQGEKSKSGYPITMLREIEMLRALSHPSIVELKGIVSSYSQAEDVSLFMVFEYMDHDITGILQNSSLKLDQSHIKCLALQLTESLAFIHGKGIVHRDIKGANCLLNNKGELKLADFGLARRLFRDRESLQLDTTYEYTNRVVTLWYRAPELLLGSTTYGCEIDIWSAACLFLELFTSTAFFPGKTEIDQLQLICKVCGSPDPESWPGCTKLPWHEIIAFEPCPPALKERLESIPEIPPAFVALVSAMLSLNPALRPSADDILKHDYFLVETPVACIRSQLPKLKGDWHEYESKLRKKEKNDAFSRPPSVGRSQSPQPSCSAGASQVKTPELVAAPFQQDLPLAQQQYYSTNTVHPQQIHAVYEGNQHQFPPNFPSRYTSGPLPEIPSQQPHSTHLYEANHYPGNIPIVQPQVDIPQQNESFAWKRLIPLDAQVERNRPAKPVQRVLFNYGDPQEFIHGKKTSSFNDYSSDAKRGPSTLSYRKDSYMKRQTDANQYGNQAESTLNTSSTPWAQHKRRRSIEFMQHFKRIPENLKKHPVYLLRAPKLEACSTAEPADADVSRGLRYEGVDSPLGRGVKRIHEAVSVSPVSRSGDKPLPSGTSPGKKFKAVENVQDVDMEPVGVVTAGIVDEAKMESEVKRTSELVDAIQLEVDAKNDDEAELVDQKKLKSEVTQNVEVSEIKLEGEVKKDGESAQEDIVMSGVEVGEVTQSEKEMVGQPNDAMDDIETSYVTNDPHKATSSDESNMQLSIHISSASLSQDLRSEDTLKPPTKLKSGLPFLAGSLSPSSSNVKITRIPSKTPDAQPPTIQRMKSKSPTLSENSLFKKSVSEMGQQTNKSSGPAKKGPTKIRRITDAQKGDADSKSDEQVQEASVEEKSVVVDVSVMDKGIESEYVDIVTFDPKDTVDDTQPALSEHGHEASLSDEVNMTVTDAQQTIPKEPTKKSLKQPLKKAVAKSKTKKKTSEKAEKEDSDESADLIIQSEDAEVEGSIEARKTRSEEPNQLGKQDVEYVPLKRTASKEESLPVVGQRWSSRKRNPPIK